jgi:hypothetical protein
MTQAFNLSQLANKVNTSGQLDVATGVTGTQAIANGGTGASSLTGNSVAITNSGGTALTTVAAGANGNVLTSNGTTWTSAAASGGQFQTQLFTAPGTWTKPASCTQVRVTVVGGGGGGGGSPTSSTPGGCGGAGQAIVPVSAPVTITIGAGGAAPSVAGGTSSFGPAISSTGGGGANAVPGTCTVAVGTAIRTFPPISPAPSNVFGFTIGALSFYGFRPTGPGNNPAVSYSDSSPLTAGAGGVGGVTPNAAIRAGGVGGAILVEFVG